MAEQIIDLNNKTPQELVDMFFQVAEGSGIFKLKYSDELRIKILDNMTEELRQCFLDTENEYKFYIISNLKSDDVIKKMIQKQIINWSKLIEKEVCIDAKLLLTRKENIDFISDQDKNTIRELSKTNSDAFYELSFANKQALNDKIGLNLKYDDKFENELACLFSQKYLSELQNKMKELLGPVSGPYCWAKATFHATNKIYDYDYWDKNNNLQNILFPYMKDIRSKYPSAWRDSLGYSGEPAYSCLYEHKKNMKPIVDFNLEEEDKKFDFSATLFKSGFSYRYDNIANVEFEFSGLDFRDLISAVLDGKCPVVVGKGNHAQYLGEDMNKRKLFLRYMVEFLFSKHFEEFTNDDYCTAFSLDYIANSKSKLLGLFLETLFNLCYALEDDFACFYMEQKVDSALKNIKDPIFRCYEKIKFGKFFCEEFIRLYIDERDKNKLLYPDPNDLIDAVLKDFVENHIDKNLFEEEKPEEKPIDPPKNDNEQKENQDKPPENPISSTKPENPPNIEKKETSDQKFDSHQGPNNQKHESYNKTQENLDKPPENPIGVPKAKGKVKTKEINLDQEIDELSKTIKKSDEIKNLKANLESVGRFEDFTRSFKEAVIKNVKDIRDTFENYLKDTKKNPKPDLKIIKIQLKNYVELYIPEGTAKSKFIQQINDFDKVSAWQKFLEIIIGIFSFDKKQIYNPTQHKIFKRVKELSSNGKLNLCDTKNDRV